MAKRSAVQEFIGRLSGSEEIATICDDYRTCLTCGQLVRFSELFCLYCQSGKLAFSPLAVAFTRKGDESLPLLSSREHERPG
jgi:hypothetical protein